MVKRPAQIAPRVPLTPEQIQQAQYVGSPEHKTERWWNGLPEAYVGSDGIAQRPSKQLTTVCPLVTETERDTATSWVQQALRLGQLRYFEGDKDFPKRLWYRDCDGQIWTGYCLNGILGHYKGWPIGEREKIEIFG